MPWNCAKHLKVKTYPNPLINDSNIYPSLN